MKMKKAALLMAVAASLAAGTCVPGPFMAALAANSGNESNDTSLTDALKDSDIIDTDKKGSITIRKYDISAAEAAEKYEEGELKATGQQNRLVETILKPYAIEGVEFTYLKVGNVEQYTKNGHIWVVYEIPEALRKILKLEIKDKTDMTGLTYTAEDGTQKNACSGNTPHAGDGVVWHYTTTQIDNALQSILSDDDVAAKNDLEAYLHSYSTQDTDTDDAETHKNSTASHGTLTTNKEGFAQVEGIDLGLYLIVETKVPDQVTDTVNPWFAAVPFTNTAYDGSNDNTNEYYSDHKGDGTNRDETAGGNETGGELWYYDAFFYPKNQTGNPTFDKSVRNAYNANADGLTDYTNKNRAVAGGTDYIGASDSRALVTFNGQGENGNRSLNWPSRADWPAKVDSDGKQYVANRGGYTLGSGQIAGDTGSVTGIGAQDAIAHVQTDDGKDVFSTDYEYRDTTTASEGDLLDYMLLSKLPHITSTATYLSEYTFTDQIEKGLSYSDDFKVAFYDNKADAKVNNTKNAVEIWDGGEKITYQSGTPKSITTGASSNETKSGYLTVYSKSSTNSGEGSKDGEGSHDGEGRVLQLTEEGLKRINGINTKDKTNKGSAGAATGYGYSDYYMVVYYTVKVNSDQTATLGDKGNKNDASLLWSRTDNSHYEILQDRNYVYSYGIDLTKLFTGTNNNNTKEETDQGNFSKVQFKLYNRTDGYYVKAKKTEDGVYDVTGKNVKKNEGTTFVPNNSTDKGKLQIRGLEADNYQLTEISTDDGFVLLKDDIDIVITATDRDIKASVEGVTGLTVTADAADRIIRNYGKNTDYDTKTGEGTTINNEGYSKDDNKDTPRGVQNEDGQYVNKGAESDVKGGKGAAYSNEDSTGDAQFKKEDPNGDTIGDTDLYVGDIHPASATVDGQDADMTANGALLSTDGRKSENAAVYIEVTNTKGFHLPDTGGNGVYLVTIAGMAAAAAGVTVAGKRRRKEEK